MHSSGRPVGDRLASQKDLVRIAVELTRFFTAGTILSWIDRGSLRMRVRLGRLRAGTEGNPVARDDAPRGGHRRASGRGLRTFGEGFEYRRP